MRDDTIEAACVVAMALAWACLTAVRLLLVPTIAVVVVLLTPRRRPAPQPEPALPAVSLATLAAELQALPAVELRQITGCRRRIAKRAMVEAWLAMPI